MKRTLNTLVGWAAAHHLRWITITLLILAFTVGAHILSAQAQTPDPDWPAPSVHLLTHVPVNPEHICPGDELVIYVFVNISDIPPSQRPVRGGVTYGQYHVSGVPIEARGAAHGSISPSTSTTRWMPSESDDPMFGTFAPFVYQARDPGNEELRFWTDYAGGRGVTFKLKVEDCNTIVSMIERGEAHFPGGHATYFGAMEPVALVEVSRDHYTGSGVFQEGEAWSVPPCNLTVALGPSPTEITAQKHDGMMDITLTYQAPSRVNTATCFGKSASASPGDVPPPIVVSIPAAGGTGTYTVSGPGYFADYIVILEMVGNPPVSTHGPVWAGSPLSLGYLLSLAGLRGGLE